MSRLLLILILTLSFQSWTKADDISDFEMEGISIGDTILRYMNASEIESRKVDYYKDLTFSSINIYSDDEIVNFETYNQIVLGFKTDDKNYSIVAMLMRDHIVTSLGMISALQINQRFIFQSEGPFHALKINPRDGGAVQRGSPPPPHPPQRWQLRSVFLLTNENE